MKEETLKVKAQAVTEISAEIKAAQSYVVCEYRGLSVAKVTELRRELAKAGGKMVVRKNDLVARAAKENGYDLDSILTGPNAFVTASDDPVSVPNILVKFAKKNPNLVVKGGVVESKVLNKEEMTAVAMLPTKPVLISMLLGALQCPIIKFACAAKEVGAQKENA